MKRLSIFLCFAVLLYGFSGCAPQVNTQVVATTGPVYDFTSRLCQDTDLEVALLVTESVSCLHDYTLQVWQMRAIESSELLIISGGGLEEFLEDALESAHTICDSSAGLTLTEGETHDHDHDHGHTHAEDPHIWLSPENAKVMANNICNALSQQYPQYQAVFESNLDALLADLDALQAYGDAALSQLQCRELITFHDGFSYFAEAFHLTILKAVEEESGSEASAADLKELVGLVEQHSLPAIFTEENGSVSAASVIGAETGAAVYALDMAMGDRDYFTAMYHNIDTIKEALG